MLQAASAQQQPNGAAAPALVARDAHNAIPLWRQIDLYQAVIKTQSRPAVIELLHLFYHYFFKAEPPSRLQVSESSLETIERRVDQLVEEMSNAAFRESPYRISGCSDESEKFGESQKAVGGTCVKKRVLFPAGVDPSTITECSSSSFRY